MDLSMITAAVSGLKAASDIAKGISTLHTMAEVQDTVIKLQRTILDAQDAALEAKRQLMDADEELRAARAQLKMAADFGAEKPRFALVPVPGGVVRALRVSAKEQDEPPYYLCPNCFDQGRRSMLHNGTDTPGRETDWLCNACKVRISTGYRGDVAAEYAPG